MRALARTREMALCGGCARSRAPRGEAVAYGATGHGPGGLAAVHGVQHGIYRGGPIAGLNDPLRRAVIQGIGPRWSSLDHDCVVSLGVQRSEEARLLFSYPFGAHPAVWLRSSGDELGAHADGLADAQ